MTARISIDAEQCQGQIVSLHVMFTYSNTVCMYVCAVWLHAQCNCPSSSVQTQHSLRVDDSCYQKLVLNL